jgi:hypothetical protein
VRVRTHDEFSFRELNESVVGLGLAPKAPAPEEMQA